MLKERSERDRKLAGQRIKNGSTGSTESGTWPPFWIFIRRYAVWLERRLQNQANVTHLVSLSGLAEDPHESDNGNYGDQDDDN